MYSGRLFLLYEELRYMIVLWGSSDYLTAILCAGVPLGVIGARVTCMHK